MRGIGLLLGVECDSPEIAARACAGALARGVIVVPSGDDGRVIGISPPLNIDPALLDAALELLCAALC